MPRRRATPSSRKPFDVTALWALRRIGTPTVAPDGSAACAAVTSWDVARDEESTALWLFPTGEAVDSHGKAPRARPLTSGDKDTDPAWSPDGRWIAFTAKRKDDQDAQLYVISPAGGEAQRVGSAAGGVTAIKWFADGRRIAFVAWVWPDLRGDAAQKKRLAERKASKVKASVTERGEYRYWDHWLADGREPHVFACDVASGRCTDLLAGTGLALQPWEPSAEHYDLAPDGRELALTIDPAAEPGMMNRCDIVVVDLRRRRVRNLTSRSGMSDEHPRYSPDGRWIAFHAYDTARAFNDQGRLRLYARRTATAVTLAPRFDRASTELRWAPDSSAVMALVEDRGRIGVWRYPVAGGAPTCIVPGGAVAGFASSSDGRTLVFARSTARHPAALFACDGDGGGERPIETLNQGVMDRHALGEVREITVKGFRGEPVQMVVTFPPGFDARRKWPLLQSIHGGPHSAHHDGWHFRWNNQVFAGQGYVVAQVNYHGSSGFGQRFIESITGHYGEREMADIEAGTDHLLRLGYIDRARLTAAGGSYGGYLVAWMNGHTRRYRAYVCHAGCYDWVSMMATDGYRFFARELGAFPWVDEARVLRQSPHHYVGHARTPTLVVHGELDYRVPATQALQYYNTLKAKGVAARLVWFPDENHWILKQANARLWHAEFFAWLARHAPRR
ncbi:MAG TPA: S9 family peptidase [Casimicrobiaceae bacterium]|nr:S9 family peptidase [Casimicrobiaceae bacterium]